MKKVFIVEIKFSGPKGVGLERVAVIAETYSGAEQQARQYSHDTYGEGNFKLNEYERADLLYDSKKLKETVSTIQKAKNYDQLAEEVGKFYDEFQIEKDLSDIGETVARHFGYL